MKVLFCANFYTSNDTYLGQILKVFNDLAQSNFAKIYNIKMGNQGNLKLKTKNQFPSVCVGSIGWERVFWGLEKLWMIFFFVFQNPKKIEALRQISFRCEHGLWVLEPKRLLLGCVGYLSKAKK